MIPTTAAGKIQMITELCLGWYDEDGEFHEPILTKEEAMELLNMGENDEKIK